ACIAACVPFAAHADLYRWVDPQTGSAKFSSTPPPWYGDPEKERSAPAVEVVPYRAHGGAAVAEKKPAAGVAGLEARWADLLRYFASLPPGTDFSGLQQQLQEYAAAGAELNRRDPAGAQRRRAQEAAAMAKVGPGK
ncbi:MAG TPA: hypothetical protein VNC62_08830, partial [Burkholderiales bacterium]|nr:hypothetical protein [Burkholderiales bacterium]